MTNDIKNKTKKLIKELKKMESGVFKFYDGKVIYYSLDEYLNSLHNKITNLQQRIDKAIEYIDSDYFWFSHRIAEEKLLNILRGEE